jgi:hypothetical protein
MDWNPMIRGPAPRISKHMDFMPHSGQAFTQIDRVALRPSPGKRIVFSNQGNLHRFLPFTLYQVAFICISLLAPRHTPRRTKIYACVDSSSPPRSTFECNLLLFRILPWKKRGAFWSLWLTNSCTLSRNADMLLFLGRYQHSVQIF